VKTTEGRDRLRFGISVTPSAASYPEIVAQVLAAERGGLDLVGIQDHPYQRRFLDTFALLADLLARTERLRFFPDVANLPLRGPAMLAKTTASLDMMSGGRFELGLGAGGFWDAIAGMGGPRRTPGESLDALEEAIALIRSVLDGERVVRGPGPHYPVPGYPPGPPPAHRVEIWIGAYRPRALRLIGRSADGWVPSLGYLRPRDIPEAGRIIDDAATAAGRDPAAIRRVVNVSGSFTPTDDAAGGDPDETGRIDGSVALWVETLSRWAVEFRADAFVVWPPDTGTADIERLGAEVVPGVRARIG
jgi:alkanesulfonate monooxygenase SsuD/methylene tetrahydromethanopterin reductase-like flavin-dependent oxidoreductase (luciferase family)